MIVVFSELDSTLYFRLSKKSAPIGALLLNSETGIFEMVSASGKNYLLSDCICRNKKISIHRKPTLLSQPAERKYINIVGLRVVNQSSDHIGSVYDFSFETETFALESIFTKKMLWGKRIIGRKNIIEITPEYIQIKDDSLVTENKPVIEAVPT